MASNGVSGAGLRTTVQPAISAGIGLGISVSWRIGPP
jgi:hypothetical protein